MIYSEWAKSGGGASSISYIHNRRSQRRGFFPRQRARSAILTIVILYVSEYYFATESTML